jgi:DNA helicase-2/ATP-dependent DNA helicase PcrA
VSATSDREVELENERLTERRYAMQLDRDFSRLPKSTSFTGRKVPDLPPAPRRELVGRVALRDSDDVMLAGRNDFYLAERHATVDGVEVYSWSAPIACVYFRKNHRHEGREGLGEMCAGAVVLRSFGHTDGQISDFADDVLSSDAATPPFPALGLVIPRAPKHHLPGGKPLPGAQKPLPKADVSHPFPIDAMEPSGAPVATEPSIRAESLLRSQLHAPRARGLGPVLATLQGDQYELVTVPAMDSMVIEGKPGTGKTIIASHRAAYLVNDQTPPENALDGRVLIVGPTPEYSRHIRDVVDRLADDASRVVVMSLPELMREVIGVKANPQGPVATAWQGVDWNLGRLSGSAIERRKAESGAVLSLEAVYACLRTNNAGGKPLTQDPDWTSYLKSLPEFKVAIASRAHHPLLAVIAWQVERPRSLNQIEHIIVDESQDVTELEWFFLQAINEAHAWTILGDLNQRRSDFTCSSWQKVFDVLTIDTDTPVRQLRRGYRSTKPILEFANKLLPRNERAYEAFQYGGVAPAIINVKVKELGTRVVAEVDRLASNYPAGSVAIISVTPDLARRALPRSS